MTPNVSYRGRFAPSPTGPLHFGSLVSALASYLEAKHHQGQWLVRIEDLDPFRQPVDATPRILHSLSAHGLIGDEPVRYQSQRYSAYRAAAETLVATGHAYFCRCSRKQLKASKGQHPNHCRNHYLNPSVSNEHPWPPGDFALRFALRSQRCRWTDQLLGEQQQSLQAETDDPVILRKEGFYAYQLAVVVDDIDQSISHVVRGSDLRTMTAAQHQMFQALGAAVPQFLHIPVIRNQQGQKLSKQNHAPALDDTNASANLLAALNALGQQPSAQLARQLPATVLAWAHTHWQRSAIPVPTAQHW
ncbi:glutamate--tRNA ligase [Marinobacter psychrophilus]|jgi:glutamyl-Q tRNA(Asp) synthetase|uniref:Glutamate--tRNA ligase n=1 Tax=Marinobacter psychrophilus TaxID=330734 RepID=A0A0H4HXT4_9GAMM|nr:tRNA glutamyl-Q(34) synthetase GluQRS [Marinobacter psychrophilus]AKO51514.1 glutamate--tRNA ligase [Marinobacter psychrophilus]